MKIITMILVSLLFFSCSQSNEGAVGSDAVFERKGIQDNPLLKTSMIKKKMYADMSSSPANIN